MTDTDPKPGDAERLLWIRNSIAERNLFDGRLWWMNADIALLLRQIAARDSTIERLDNMIADLHEQVAQRNTAIRQLERREIARVIHESRMRFCYMPGVPHRKPWPAKLPGDFGYEPQPWVDIAWEQAGAVIKAVAAVEAERAREQASPTPEEEKP